MKTHLPTNGRSMKPLFKYLGILIFAFLLSGSSIAGTLYEWTDENGVIHLTTEPPPENIKYRESKYKEPSVKKQYKKTLSDAGVYNDQGVYFSDRGQYDDAISYFTKAIKLSPNFDRAYFNRGTAYAKGKGQHDKAISDFSKALEINPRYVAACYNRGISSYHKNVYDLACSDFKRACVLGDCKGYEWAKSKGVCQ